MLILIRYVSLPTFLNPTCCFTIASIMSNPPILCASESQHVSHKTLKIYLCGIHLWHIEDPTSDPLLQLVCRDLRSLQGDRCHSRLPITINILHTIKRELRQSRNSMAEQRLLWSVITLGFYGFLWASEYLNLWWSDISCTHRIFINQRMILFEKAIKSSYIKPVHLPAYYELSCCTRLQDHWGRSTFHGRQICSINTSFSK